MSYKLQYLHSKAGIEVISLDLLPDKLIAKSVWIHIEIKMEIELWPQMIAQAKRLGVPLIMAQAQYPDKSFARDQKGFGRIRARSIQGFDLILAKSQRHAERFRHFGAKNVRVTGELRFEQTIPQTQLDAAGALLETIDPKRLRICLASTAPDEDPMLIPVVQELLKNTIGPKPLSYIPSPLVVCRLCLVG